MKRKSIVSLLLCLCLLLSAVPFYAGSGVSAKDADIAETGNPVYYIETYEQLKAHALIAQGDCRYILNADIEQTDNQNDMEVVIPAGADFKLDLNGYSIKRSTMGNDQALFRIKSGGAMTITDTSDSNTGYCCFSEGYADYTKAVFFNEGGELEIIKGYYEILSPYQQGSCTVVYAKSGYTNIYDGTFDSSSSWGGDTITVVHDSYVYDTPLVVIFGGEFYGKYQSIDASAYGDYLKYGKEYPEGALHPVVYVLGGNFYVTNGGKDGDDASFAYCNNGWGRVFVAEGTVFAKCLNARDQRFLEGVSKKYFTETVDDFTGGYYRVTAPPLIMSDGIDYYYRLINLCKKAEVNSYGNSVYEMLKEEFDYINENIDTIMVSETDKAAPLITLENRTADHKYVNWYMCEESSYNGKDTQWTHLGNYQNVSQWQFDERPENGGSYIIRCVLTNSDLRTYEDIIRIYIEPLKEDEIISSVEVNDVAVPVAGKSPDYDASCVTRGCNVTKVEWYDVTEGKGMLMAENATFEAGRSYRVVVRVDVEDNYVYETDDINANVAVGVINGQKAIAYSSYDNTYLELGYTFAPCEGGTDIPTNPTNPSDPSDPSDPDKTDPTKPADPVGILGDADVNSKVNVKDATAIQKHVADIAKLSETGAVLADADGNTKINIKDATAIQKHVAGIVTGLPIGELV